MEKFSDGKLVSKLLSDEIRWDSIKNKWHIRNYYIRDFIDDDQRIRSGQDMDTTISLTPQEFRRRDNAVEAMNLGELNIIHSRAETAGCI